MYAKVKLTKLDLMSGKKIALRWAIVETEWTNLNAPHCRQNPRQRQHHHQQRQYHYQQRQYPQIQLDEGFCCGFSGQQRQERAEGARKQSWQLGRKGGWKGLGLRAVLRLQIGEGWRWQKEQKQKHLQGVLLVASQHCGRRWWREGRVEGYCFVQWSRDEDREHEKS